MLAAVTGGAMALVALALMVVAVMWWFQDRLLYLPLVPGSIHNKDPRHNMDDSQRSPSFYGIEYHEAFVETHHEGVQVHLWILLTDEPKTAPTVAFFHGNAGNIGHRLPFADDFVSYARANMVLVEYRGYGKSGGLFSEEDIVQDAVCVMDYLEGRADILDPSRLFVMGRSLGGAVTVALAEHYVAVEETPPFKGIILENTFLSIPRVVGDFLSELVGSKRVGRDVANLLVWLDWNNARRIKRIGDIPVLFMSGEDDEIVPRSHMLDLYVICSSKEKRFLSFPGGDHNFTWCRPNYFEGLSSFLHPF